MEKPMESDDEKALTKKELEKFYGKVAIGAIIGIILGLLVSYFIVIPIFS